MTDTKPATDIIGNALPIQIAASLWDSGGAAGSSAEVVELGATHAAKAGDLNVVNAGRVDQESPLDANAVGGHPADREVLVDATATATDHDSLEHLDTLSRSLDHLGVDTNGVARAKIRDFPLLFLLQ